MCHLLSSKLVLTLETFYSTGGVYYFLFTGKERMALATQLHSQYLFGGASGESIAAGADYLGIIIIFRMDLGFHFILCGINADLSLATGCWLIFDRAANQGEKRVVFANADIVAWVDACSPLPHQYGAGINPLTIVPFYS